MSTDGRSSPFVVVGTGLVVFMCPSSLVVSGVRRLRAMVAVFDQAWWWWGRYLRLRTSVVVRGWLGCSSSPMGFPGLWAVGLWSFGCLLFVAAGGERRSYLRVVVAVID